MWNGAGVDREGGGWGVEIILFTATKLVMACVTQVDSLLQRKLEPDICLEEEVSRNWTEILFQFYQFDRLGKEVRLLGVFADRYM